MTTLKASPSARRVLNRKKIEELAVLIRGRIEAYPALANLFPKLHAAEAKIVHMREDEAEPMLRQLDEAVERHEASLVDANERAAGQRQDQLLAEAGIETDRHETTGSGTRHGFMWLERKERVTGRRRIAGQNWGRDYSLASNDGLRSCLNDNVPGGGDTPAPQDRKSEARGRLEQGRAHIRYATGSENLANLLDAVCGRGDTLRALSGGDKIGAAVKEAELMIALDMAAEAYDLREDRSRISGGRDD